MLATKLLHIGLKNKLNQYIYQYGYSINRTKHARVGIYVAMA